MSHRSRKRKQRPEHRRGEEGFNTDNYEPRREPDAALYVVAHEADIVRGPQAALAARSLEVVEYLPNQPPRKRIGDALIRWGASPDSRGQPALYNEDHYTEERQELQEEIWVDRYDARLLLDALPPTPSGPAPTPRAESPSGWSDLPSDAEDTFFFSQNEVEDYQRQKRRRTLDKAHEERLKARLAEDGDQFEEQDIWGGSDEEPDDVQKDLMRRTAVHLHSSPNPAQLEMRILANHGADKRFAFLRGRWGRAWKLMKIRLQSEETVKQSARKDSERPGGSLNALAGYGDSDEDGSHSEAEQPAETVKGDGLLAHTSKAKILTDPNAKMDDASMREARRARAKVWAESRRLARLSSSSHDPDG